MSLNKCPDITALVPVYNEEKLLAKSINRLIGERVVKKIIIIDDSSSDNSTEIIQKFTYDYQFIDSYTTPINLGKGGAINFVKDFIETEYVIIHDADLEYNPKDIRNLINKLNSNENSLVIGSRFLKNSHPQHYLRTYWANKFLSKLFSIKNKVVITDIASCYKLFSSEFFKNTVFKSNGFEFEVEIVAKYLKYSEYIYECGIDYQSRTYKEGKKIKFIDFFKYIYAIFKY
jgi:glycosyltransferase involved in cell wall biosynthesis